MTLSLSRPDLLKEDCYLAGEWTGSEQRIAVTNPATGETIANVPKMGAPETKAAIDAAEAAMADWSRRTAKDRAGVLRKWADLMKAHRDDLAVIMTAEQGKPLGESRGEIDYSASFLEWFGEEGKRVYGDIIPGHQPDKRILVMKQPVGVCAAITPWNFPSAMIGRKVGPALAAGCGMVIKPATATPLSAFAMCVLAEEAGVPKGLLSCLTGGASDIAGEMTSNFKVRKLTFTGSTEVGAKLMAACSENITKVSLELGGNAPFLVFDDADIDDAVEGALSSKFRNAGQTCVCANRIYVQAGVYDQFLEKFETAVRKLSVGNGMDEGTDIGPLIDRDAVEKVKEHVEDAVSKGARVVVGGGPDDHGDLFYTPTLLADVPVEAQPSTEETFGPLAPVYRFETVEEGIRLANDTVFGLAAYFYARDYARVMHVAESLEYGIVGHNTGLISTEVAPFGGVKQSGLGREGSKYGIDDYLEIKYLCMSGVEARS
ncbi:succinate-semialdehyde dehydrogenase (NADP(+)) [Pacificimonas flava]|uniref:Succinate-semialdehyde dehydrogenase (NADP(+)) n=2 Tax=Pacificimonas TaxID=1960290 RepID=A0A219B7N3_9SPHN|nr:MULTISPECIES: NAD-dependent succinate-semialdehyde dehydrogenase [Pacificimonas]MBZ6378429.1 NAD-dependent succinate-semialdehyde dehydrogenase [Pacificimonas aurantium]OWV34271.1 succinate-semialdehyde dehydrogenase (NADP(+)) [Pacificimonas flava]